MITETTLENKMFDLRKISNPGESWKLIFSGRYAVSNYGRVISFYFKDLYRFRVMTLRDSAGYLRAHLHVDGKSKLISVHRLVAMAFIPNPGNLPEVNHKDGDKHNNHVGNLEWVSKSQNKRHSIDVLKRPHPNQGRCLNDSVMFREVEQYSLNGELIESYHSIRVASTETGVNETNISRCANGKRKTAGGFIWKFV